MAPKIGLTSSTDDQGTGSFSRRCCVNSSYIGWVERCGGLPLLLPNVAPELAPGLLDTLDGLLLTGGDDLHPLCYDTEPEQHLGAIDVPRDRFELPLAREALRRGLPIFGICRGIQTLNVVAGGDLRQDLVHDATATVQHQMRARGGPVVHHRLTIEPGTRLAGLLGEGPVAVNSYHHQAVGRLGDGLRVGARAADGVIEAVEGTGDAFVLAVQWHPEVMDDNPVTRALFEAFLAACGP